MIKKPFLIVLMALILLSSGCTPPKPFDSWRGKLEVKGTPSLNSEVELVLTINPLVDMPGTTLLVWLPDGVELVSGDRRWQGNAAKEESLTFPIKLRVISNGQQLINLDTVDRFRNAYRHQVWFLTVGRYGFVRENSLWLFPYKKPLPPGS